MAARISFKRLSDDYLADLAARKYSGIEPKSAVKLLRGMGYGDNDMISADDCDGLRTAAAYAIAKIKNKSYKEYVVFNDFFAFLGDEARHNGYAFDIKPLPRQLTALERQITIAKMLHGKDDGGFSEDKLAEEFMVSIDTIRNDMQGLRYGISVFDQRFSVDYKRYSGRLKMVSTAHPVFLTPNLTEIVFLLEGLRLQDKDMIRHDYLWNTAVSIWSQLSDYARNRILNVLCDIMGLDKSWYAELDRDASSYGAAADRYAAGNGGTGGSDGPVREMFRDEISIGNSHRRMNLLMYCLKGSIPCNISYIGENGKQTDTGLAKIVNICDKSVIVRICGDDANVFEIFEEDILEITPATE